MLSEAVRPLTRKRTWLWRVAVAARFVLGYVLAIVTGAVILSLLLNILPNSITLFGTGDPVLTRIITLAVISAELGAMFGLPYTVVGSLVFWFVLVRRIWLFLLIGTFCPIGALLTMALSERSTSLLEWPTIFCSLPAGLAAAYVYGAIGFGFGFHRWRFE